MSPLETAAASLLALMLSVMVLVIGLLAFSAWVDGRRCRETRARLEEFRRQDEEIDALEAVWRLL